jgi:Resolvase, N terminal domain
MTEIHPERKLFGYARVSTYGQTLDSQLEQLRKAGCSSRNIYREKATGARPDRRELLRMLKRLAPGDVVTVTRIDRLARSTFDLFGIIKRIVDANAEFRSLAGTVGRHRHQSRALDAGGTREPRRRGARSDPHPDSRRPEPRQGPRKAYGPSPFPHTGTKERGHQAARARRDARRTRAQLQCEQSDDFEARGMKNGTALPR